MIIEEIKGNVFSAPNHFYFVHCISADCSVSKGIVVDFQKKYHIKNSLESIMSTESNKGKIGFCIRTGIVFNLVTKKKYWHKPSIYSMYSAIADLAKQIELEGILNIAMPKIGCGLDKLQWGAVRGILESIFSNTNTHIKVYHL